MLPRPIILFYNPNCGRYKSSEIEKIYDFFKSEFGGCKLLNQPDELRNIHHSHIIAIGGDGTFHVAINHAGISDNTFTCLAMGSGNDFVTGFPRHGLEVLCVRIRQEKIQETDLIECNGVRAHNIAGIGFEALVAKKSHERKWKIPALKYVIPVIKNLFTFQPVNVEFSSENYSYNGRVFMISMGNGKRAGGGFKLFPKASLTDGKMDVLMIEPPSVLQKLRYVWLVNFGRHLGLKIIKYLQVEKCSIQLGEGGYFEADGDVYPAEKLDVRVMPGALKVIQ